MRLAPHFYMAFFMCSLVSAVSASGQMLSYSSYLNPGVNQFLTGPIAVNGAGETCVLGTTAAVGVSTVSQFRSDGSLVYSVSDPFTSGAFVAIDSLGNCYVVGTGTLTPTSGAFQAVPKSASKPQFVVKLNGSGSVVYATYLGGSGDDFPSGIAVDSNGNVYITGSTDSNDFPTRNAFQASLATAPDAYITALNATGTALLYSTYLGGNSSDRGISIAVDSSGNAYVTGGTGSTNFPTVAPLQGSLAGATGSGFVIKLNASGTPIYSTYLGGSGDSNGIAITADATGNAYVAGESGPGFPLVNPIQNSTSDSSTTVSKLNPSGSALIYSTYLGEITTPVGIQVDSAGQAYVAGNVLLGGSLPLAAPIQSSFGVAPPDTLLSDSFVSVINASGTSLTFSSYLGGDSNDTSSFGIDSAGDIYLSGFAAGPFPVLNATNGVYFPLVHNEGTGNFYPTYQYTVSKILLSAGSSLSYPATVDFTPNPKPVGGSTNAAPILLANTSASINIAISNIAITGDFSQTNNCPSTLPAATSCEFQVTLTPMAGGQRQGSVTITDNAPGSPHVIALIGTGQAPVAVPAPTSMRFSSQAVGTSSAAQNVTLNNTGDALLFVPGVTTTGDFTESNTCGSGVAAGMSCQIAVVFAPSAAGTRTGTLTITDNAPASPQTVSLTGTGASPSLGLGLPTGGSGSATVTAGGTATYTLTIGAFGARGVPRPRDGAIGNVGRGAGRCGRRAAVIAAGPRRRRRHLGR